jgi:hypothetical protein
MIKSFKDLRAAKRPAKSDKTAASRKLDYKVETTLESRKKKSQERSFTTNTRDLGAAAREMRRQAKARGKKRVAFTIKNSRGSVVGRTPFSSSRLSIGDQLVSRAARKYKLQDDEYELYIIEE